MSTEIPAKWMNSHHLTFVFQGAVQLFLPPSHNSMELKKCRPSVCREAAAWRIYGVFILNFFKEKQRGKSTKWRGANCTLVILLIYCTRERVLEFPWRFNFGLLWTIGGGQNFNVSILRVIWDVQHFCVMAGCQMWTAAAPACTTEPTEAEVCREGNDKDKTNGGDRSGSVFGHQHTR